MLDDPTIRKAVEFAVATEEVAAQVYSKLAHRFSEQEEISEVFSLLATDEKKHRAQFKALLNKLPPDADNTLEVAKHLFLCAMARSQFFTGEGGIAAALEKSQTVDEALVHALEVEKATLGFYQALEDVLGQEEALQSIIAAEKEHIARLIKYIITDEKMKGLADKF